MENIHSLFKFKRVLKNSKEYEKYDWDNMAKSDYVFTPEESEFLEETFMIRDKCRKVIENIIKPPQVKETETGLKVIFTSENEVFELEVDDNALSWKSNKIKTAD